jgi:hypothetical protein
MTSSICRRRCRSLLYERFDIGGYCRIRQNCDIDDHVDSAPAKMTA